MLFELIQEFQKSLVYTTNEENYGSVESDFHKENSANEKKNKKKNQIEDVSTLKMNNSDSNLENLYPSLAHPNLKVAEPLLVYVLLMVWLIISKIVFTPNKRY